MYNKIVDSLKEIARDGLRMKMIIPLQSERASITADINKHDTAIGEVKKDIARANFKQTQIVDTDPDKEEKTLSLAELVKHYEEEIVNITKHKEALVLEQKEVEQRIVDVQEGKVKVCLDKLNAITAELVTEVMKDTAVAKAQQIVKDSTVA